MNKIELNRILKDIEIYDILDYYTPESLLMEMDELDIIIYLEKKGFILSEKKNNNLKTTEMLERFIQLLNDITKRNTLYEKIEELYNQ